MAANFDLTGRVALVTGASRGLGEGMALALAGAGADVALASRDEKGLQAVARKVEALGRKALVHPIDLASIAGIEPMVARVVAGLGRLDILVNNAGTNVRKPAVEFTEKDWDGVVNVNLKSVFFCTIAAGRAMMKQGGGKVISTASLTSTIGIANIPAYAASKSGLMGMTRVLAVEWAKHNIQVNAIAPGYFKTDLTAPLFEDPARRAWILGRIPLGRSGLPEDLAGAVVFLASPASDYLTGQLINVDGGWLAG